jgi:hypothetical protein
MGARLDESNEKKSSSHGENDIVIDDTIGSQC